MDDATVDEHDFLPGTSRLVESTSQQASSHLLRHGDIILDPQPTKSPNDPLNWSFLRKYWHVTLVCFITALTAATSNDAGTAQYGENADLGISYSSMNTGAGVLFAGIGYFTLLISPAAWLYGRRISYLVCMFLGVGGATWFARVQKTEDSIWNQLFVGASEACAEANVQLSLSDLFFQHQRGTVLGIYVLATSVGTYMGPMISSYIADSSEGWRWIGWWSVIISSTTILVFYLTGEETFFERPHASVLTRGELSPAFTTEKAAIDPNGDLSNDMQKTSSSLNKTTSDIPPAENDLADDPPKTYWQRIALITPAPNLVGTGFKQYFARLFHTLRIFSFPAVIYSGIQWGAQDAWLTFYLTVEENDWYNPPYNYSDVGVGLMNVPCLIGAVIGCFWGGYLSDLFVLWMAKRNKGIREAEHRLWMMFPVAILSPLGMWLFGIGTSYGWNWPVPYVGLGMIGFGWGCAGDLSLSYLMDAYPEMVLEGMVGVSVINNSIALIFTFTASIWLGNSGTKMTFVVIGILDFIFVCLTVPMMVWGKRCRRWTRGRYENFVRIRDQL